MILCITGPPRAGKSWLSDQLEELVPGVHVVHTDKWKHELWEQVPIVVRDHVADVAPHYDHVVVEGVQVARAIRKGLVCDLLIVISRSLEELTPRQRGLGKSIEKWLQSLSPLVPVERFEHCQEALTRSARALGST